MSDSASRVDDDSSMNAARNQSHASGRAKESHSSRCRWGFFVKNRLLDSDHSAGNRTVTGSHGSSKPTGASLSGFPRAGLRCRPRSHQNACER